MIFHRFLTVSLLMLCALLASCSSSPSIRKQAYAELRQEQTYEYDFPTVWKGIEESLRKYRIADRDPSDVSNFELKKLTHRTLETDWVYGQSRDKYHEFEVNGSPRKIYLQTRYKYLVDAQTVLGGVKVKVSTEEEVERLKSDGSPNGYTSVSEKDTSRGRELIDNIMNAIRSAAP